MGGHADLDDVDRDALERAMQICANRDPSRAEQLDGKLRQGDPLRPTRVRSTRAVNTARTRRGRARMRAQHNNIWS
jgi:hypothetical protein